MPFENKIPVVFDTNILVSAFTNGGIPAQALQIALSSEFELYLSFFILEELKRVLELKLGHSPSLVEDFILELRESSTVINPKETLSIIKEKTSDNRILEVALASEALFLITGDRKHILLLRKIGNAQIITPREFVKVYENL